MNTKLIGPLMGIVFVVLLIVAFVIGGETPGTDDSAQKIVDFYVDNDSEQGIAAAALALASVAFIFFLGSLRRALRAAADDEGGLSTVTALGGLTMAIGITIFAGLTFTLGDTADDMPAAATVALNSLNSDMFFTLAAGTAVFNLGLGLATLRHGGLPKALGWVALAVGIVAMTPVGFFAFLVTGIVVVWVSIALMMDAGEPAAPPMASGPPAATP